MSAVAIYPRYKQLENNKHRNNTGGAAKKAYAYVLPRSTVCGVVAYVRYGE